LSPADLFALALWPLAALGVWIARKALSLGTTGYRRKVLAAVALLLAVGPFVALVVLFPHHSAIVLASEYSLMVGFGVLFLVIAWRAQMTRFKLIAIAVMGVVLLGAGLWYLGGDFLIRRARVDGFVTDKRYEKRNATCRRCWPDYYVYLGSRRYAATARVFETVEAGNRIRGKFGRASRRIISADVLPR
jgi:hypothetical protein